MGDATVLEIRDGEFRYDDVLGESVTGKQRLLATGRVIGGAWKND